MRSPHRVPASIVAGVLAAAVVAGCGSAAASSDAAPQRTAAEASHQDMNGMQGMQGMGDMPGMEGMDGFALWAVQTGPLGVITTDDAGHMLYRFDGDSAAPSTSTCTGPCTDTWKPVLEQDGKQPDLMGVDQQRVGTLQRADGGVQVTLAGWPLYYNTTDQPGLGDAGHNGADGKWFAITPKGDKAKTS